MGIERDLQCAICSSPFKSAKSANQYTSDTLTFGDYLPPILDSLVNLEDDMDESIQFAIICSYDDYTPTHSNTHLYAKSQIKKSNANKARKSQKNEVCEK